MAWSFPTWREFSGSVLRAAGYRYEEPKQLPTGVASSSPQSATFPVLASMGAFAAFPWVRAAVQDIAEDLAGLPLRLTKGKGKNAVVIEEHPVLDLFSQPTRDMTRVEWETQLWTYALPVGWCPVLIVGVGTPVSLKLLHPERTRIISDTTGTVEGVEFQPLVGGVIRYPIESVALLRFPSWRSGDQEAMGEGFVSALKDGLASTAAASKHAAKQAAQGRPGVIIRPKDAGMTLTKDQRESVAAEAGRWMAEGRPAFVLSGAVDMEFPNLSPRDLEFNEQRLATRDEVLAVTGVTPTRVGLPTANYATAQQQDAIYWQTLRAKAARLDAIYTRIARMFDPALTVVHDFSGVQALQESRDARLARVTEWVMLGAEPAAAAAYEGFEDAPLTAQPTPAATPAPTDAVPAKSLALLFRAKPDEDVTDGENPPALVCPEDEEGRAVVWRGWLDTTHTPAEKRMAISTARALRAQRDRVVQRLLASPFGQRGVEGAVTRDFITDLLRTLFPPDEAGLYADSLRAPLADTIRAGFRSGAAQLGRRWYIDSGTADILTERRLGEHIAYATPTTQDAVQEAIVRGIAEGESVNDIAARVRACRAFAPSRSLAIARTETTRSLSAGHTAAYAKYAEVEGVTVRKQWLSARDGEVRDAHRHLDGQVREVGEAFKIEAGEYVGATANGPGEFTEAALVVNCRCTTVPVTEAA